MATVHTCQFVLASEVIGTYFGEHEIGEVWASLSDNAPFSWGDNNRTLVTAEALANHFVDRLDDSPASLALQGELFELDQMYVDLEN